MKPRFFCKLAIFVLLFSFTSSYAQIDVIRATEYRRITDWETPPFYINAMKISSDGTRIVFATSGPAVKIFTLNSDGTGLTQVYDFERTGSGCFVDIDASGDKVIWTDRDGEIFIANADGSSRLEIATLLPNPNPIWADIEPQIPLPPRITADGSQVYFINMTREPAAAGVWRVNADGSDLRQVFNYNELSQELFGRDGSEYNFNVAFADGFDISADGSRMIFGNRIFKLEDGDLNRGDVIALDGETFYHLGDYAIGNQPFSTYVDGDQFFIFRREENPATGNDEIALYAQHLAGSTPIKIIGGLSQRAFPGMVQMDGTGKKAIVLAGGGLPFDVPITLVNMSDAGYVDLVSIDCSSRALDGFDLSASTLPSITWQGDRFCFLAASNPPQIWVADILSDAINSTPSITEINIEPNYVMSDFSTRAMIKAHVTSTRSNEISTCFTALLDGAYLFRALTTDWPAGILLDDGTFGDETANDGFFTNNTVRKDLEQIPSGKYTVRISATDGTGISAVDVAPFFIKDPDPSAVEANETIPAEFVLHQNYPNPFNPETRISYSLDSSAQIDLTIYDMHGKAVINLVRKRQPAGEYTITWDGRTEQGMQVSSGMYFVRMITRNSSLTRKMMLIR